MIGMFPTLGQAQRRVALVIGNNAYEGSAKLSNPVNDSLLLGEMLQRDLGFEVIRRKDLDRRGMFDAVNEIAELGRGADAVVVYYSGHGVQGPGGNFLLPTDEKISAYEHIRRDALPVSELVSALQNTGARVALLILDACRNFAFGEKSAIKGLARPEYGSSNLLVAYATQEGSTITEGPTGGTSAYARALTEQFRRTELPLLEALDEVAETVKRETLNRQRPTRTGDMKVRTCLIQGRCVAGVIQESSRVVAPPNVHDIKDEDTEYWRQIVDQQKPYLFLQYQIRFPNGKSLETARMKVGSALKSKSGCALREFNLSLEVEFDWSGNCKDGLADGVGTKTYYRAGLKMLEWVGTLDRGLPTGTWKGTAFSTGAKAAKSITISFLADGNISPSQSFTLNDGTRYDGNTDATLASQIGNPNGKGKMIFVDGGVYEGDWVNKQRTGQGVLIFPTRNVPGASVKYTGEFKEGAFSGFGTLLQTSGVSYVGSWNNGLRNGRGKVVFADGGTYEGDFVNDRRTGRGVLTFPPKDNPDAAMTYVGEFKDAIFQGEGTMTFKSGAVYVGNWLNGKRYGRGRYSAPNGETYDGDWLEDQKSGHGTHILARTNNPEALVRYVGDFSENSPNGRGTLTWGNGAVYIGEVQNGRAHGNGELRRPDGSTVKGQFDKTRNIADGPLR